MRSQAATVADYPTELPEERRQAIAKVRAVVRKNLPKGFTEQMSHGMIGYIINYGDALKLNKSRREK